jgi:carbon-monoxide dehydrogenase medium subunit
MRRQALDCSIVSATARVTLAADGQTCGEVRLGLAAVAPTPFRPKKAEALLTGQPATPELIHAAAVQACEETSPISDVRASADYRRMLTETLVVRALHLAIERARTGGESR